MKRMLALLALCVPLCVSAQALPDWSGWWLYRQAGVPPLLALRITPPPLREALQPVLQRALSDLLDRGATSIDYCSGPQFVGFLNGEGFEDALEFLFTTNRVTLLTDVGLIRRIELRKPAALEPDPSRVGTSTGRWEGDTLVVETRGLAPELRFPLPIGGAPAIGAGASVVERIRLIAPDMLEIRSVLVAPETMTRPFEIVSTYARDEHHSGQPADNCPATDRLLDSSGGTRFDLTPPPDLPAPPR